MHIYCVNVAQTDAVTIGCDDWFDDCPAILCEDDILATCRPANPNRLPAFMSYIEEMRKGGDVLFMRESDLPEGIKRRRGYWESKGWK